MLVAKIEHTGIFVMFNDSIWLTPGLKNRQTPEIPSKGAFAEPALEICLD